MGMGVISIIIKIELIAGGHSHKPISFKVLMLCNCARVLLDMGRSVVLNKAGGGSKARGILTTTRQVHRCQGELVVRYGAIPCWIWVSGLRPPAT